MSVRWGVEFAKLRVDCGRPERRTKTLLANDFIVTIRGVVE